MACCWEWKLALLCTCKMMHTLVLAVLPPWGDNGRGLRWAVQKGCTKYYIEWASPEKSSERVPDTDLLRSALLGPARYDWGFMLSLFEDERVDPMPILCEAFITTTETSWSFFMRLFVEERPRGWIAMLFWRVSPFTLRTIGLPRLNSTMR